MNLQGYRTYIIAIAAIVAAASSFALGEMTLAEAIQAAIMGAGLGALRLGIAGK